MTDVVYRYASVEADNGPWEFVIECSSADRKPFPAFRGLSTLALAEKTVTGDFRVDAGPTRRINIGYYGGVLGIPPYEHDEFFPAISNASKLAVKVGSGYPAMVFTIAGVDEAIANACA